MQIGRAFVINECLQMALGLLCPPVTMGDHVIPIHTCKCVTAIYGLFLIWLHLCYRQLCKYA